MQFASFGIPISLDEMFTCGNGTASYLKEVVLPSIKDESKRGIYLIGQKSMEEELEKEGLTWKGGTVR
jgi:ribonucleotide monophosphatase NagD (HAD superfamily)